jgi:hypothetical protein
LIKHGGRWFLGLGESHRGDAVSDRHYGQFSPGQRRRDPLLAQSSGINARKISSNSGKVGAKQPKIARNSWQAALAVVMERLSRQYNDIFLEYPEIRR